MKNNLIGVIISVVNLILTAVLLIMMISSFKKTNALLEDVSGQLRITYSAVSDMAASMNIDVEANVKTGNEVAMSDMEPISVKWDSQNTYNLKSDGSGKEHYAKMNGYTLYLNKNSDDFGDIEGKLKSDHAQIDGVISSVISAYTYDEASQELIVKKSLKKINKLLDSDIAVELILDGYVKQ